MSSCPGRNTLLSYEQGELDDDRAAGLEGHVRTCPDCRRILDDVRQTDPDTALLRRVFDTTAATTMFAVAEQPSIASNNTKTPTKASSTDGSGGAVEPSASGAWPIQDYERVMLCGEGSYGAVWAVRDRVGVYRAMKIIDLARLAKAKVHCDEMSALETYCRKIDRHPYLITVYHVGLADRLLYYTMELADDRAGPGLVRETLPRNYRPLTLDNLIREGRLRADVAVEIVRRLLKGLSRLHASDLLHRDIKPSNVIFVEHNPKLADIGILTAEDNVGRSVGTPRYMPPDGVIDKTTDIYALGRVLEEALFGYAAARENQPVNYADLDALRWDMVRVGEVIRRACAPQGSERYASASAMLEDLEACRLLTGGSLLEEIELRARPAAPSAGHVAQRIGLALIHRIPWLVAMIVAIYGISQLAR
jgi:hypothetical protein